MRVNLQPWGGFIPPHDVSLFAAGGNIIPPYYPEHYGFKATTAARYSKITITRRS